MDLLKRDRNSNDSEVTCQLLFYINFILQRHEYLGYWEQLYR